MEVVNIVNPSLKNQRETGAWVQRGFEAHGIKCTTTDNRQARGDVTVIHGPNYAFRDTSGCDNVLWLDRCWYGDTNEWASFGWRNGDTRDFCRVGGDERLAHHIDDGWIAYRDFVDDGELLILDDYQQTILNSRAVNMAGELCYYRGHPLRDDEYPGANTRNSGSLEDALDGIGWAVCARGTSGAYALLRGVPLICLDPLNVVSPVCAGSFFEDLHLDEEERWGWASGLAWTQYRKEEIESGYMWHVLSVRFA